MKKGKDITAFNEHLIERYGITYQDYYKVHLWLKYHYGKADKCESETCTKRSTRYQWALKPGCTYEKNRDNFMHLCNGCNARADRTPEGNARIGAWRRGKPRSRAECAKAAASNRGQKRSEESLMRMRKAQSKWPVNQLSLDGTHIKTWPSACEAGRQLNIFPSNINKALKGKIRKAYGYRWTYANVSMTTPAR